MMLPSTPLVSAAWLNDNLQNSNLIVLDASIYADHSENFIRNQESVPGALLFDLRKDFVDTNSEFPNTLPTPEQFELNCRKLGVNNDSIIVIYDNRGIYTSPRAWFIFKAMSLNKVYVLNGGLPGWKKEGYTLTSLMTKSVLKGDFNATQGTIKTADHKNVLNYSINEVYCILDARSEERFHGSAPEPRPELRSGHIQNSMNLPYPQVLKNGFYKPNNELKAIFNAFKLENKQLIFSCGSGITACIILLAAEIVCSNSKLLYDGSWTEWATINKLFTT